jgi:hypothetical protein
MIVDRASVREHRLDKPMAIFGEKGAARVGRHGLAEGRKTANVDEQHRGRLSAPGKQLIRNIVREMRRKVW